MFDEECTICVPTELHGASWPDQLVYKDVTWSVMYTAMCIDCAICIILACNVYQP
jgi:hypothetical protein